MTAKYSSAALQLATYYRGYSIRNYLFIYYAKRLTNAILICRRHEVRCAGCNGRILQAEVVRRAQQYVYHLECFMCAACGLQLNTGDQFCLMEDDRKLICNADYPTITNSQLCTFYSIIPLLSSYCLLYTSDAADE